MAYIEQKSFAVDFGIVALVSLWALKSYAVGRGGDHEAEVPDEPEPEEDAGADAPGPKSASEPLRRAMQGSGRLSSKIVTKIKQRKEQINSRTAAIHKKIPVFQRWFKTALSTPIARIGEFAFHLRNGATRIALRGAAFVDRKGAKAGAYDVN